MENEELKVRPSVLEGNKGFVSKILGRSTSRSHASHMYFRKCAHVPFKWELEPGKPMPNHQSSSSASAFIWEDEDDDHEQIQIKAQEKLESASTSRSKSRFVTIKQLEFGNLPLAIIINN
ncbi:putative OSBPoxysterol binding protein-related protein 4B [Senna tora]|uniref:Putative OSBPoxysterol binding protein-related protein 4B n=1 Tax=Senna tora TaxID=362788 RepID=A0A834X565_9FABA|nr:putative OSBPoxysterol binding protein-related protein 4B [Senna tora]